MSRTVDGHNRAIFTAVKPANACSSPMRAHFTILVVIWWGRPGRDQGIAASPTI